MFAHHRLAAFILLVTFVAACGRTQQSRNGSSDGKDPIPARYTGPVTRQGITIDADFPGGNIIVESIEGNTVRLHQDQRDTKEWWFYWCFRVRGAAGRTLRFQFTQGNVIGENGPACSLDGGTTWFWLGTAVVDGESFIYEFPARQDDVRFCFSFPYVEADLHAFLRRQFGNRHIRYDLLCTTKKGRKTKVLHLGRLDGQANHRVVLTARHHACEMIASYVLEGVMEEVLAGPEDGKWLREHVEFLVVPFMDKDGVEEGDQGKGRLPHDHNRDYAGDPIYPSVASLRRLVSRWSEGRLRVALDLHCPWIRGEHNDVIYCVGGPDPGIWKNVQEFGAILEEATSGPLPYRAADNLPHGEAWNTQTGPPSRCQDWMALQSGVLVATTIEIPYAKAGGVVVTPKNARAFGHDLARALRRYLEGIGK